MRYKLVLNWPGVAAKGDILEIQEPKEIDGKEYALASDGRGWNDFVNFAELEYFAEVIE
jgi:hypothetical protein